MASIDGHRPSIFNFVGTSPASGTDASPDSYEVASGNLNLSGMEIGRAARVFGFVSPFGEAPPDFVARTAVDFREVEALLSVGWGLSGTTAPFLTIDAAGIAIDNLNPAIGLRHVIAIGPTLIDIRALPAGPRIIADTTKPGMFAIAEGRRVEIFSTFADFTAKVAEKLSGGSRAVNLTATGDFDAATRDFAAHRVLLEMRPASQGS